MCVIIYVPKEATITIDEIKNAWTTNPDGAGYSIQKDNKVYFKRGFMDLNSYLKEILPLIGNYNLLLHFRISTSKAVNAVQTHPYKKGNVTLTEGFTEKPVICMNGIISKQKEYKNCNDTMSYIIDHKEAFNNINQDIINIIEEATGAKWAVMLPNEVFLSSKFIESEGRFYSNKNHLWRSYVKTYNFKATKARKNFNNMIKNNKLKQGIRKNKELHDDVLDFIDIWCNGPEEYCDLCTKCLKSAKTLRDVKITINENYYGFYEDFCENNLDSIINELDNSCFIEDNDYYNDIYDYDNPCSYYLFDE